MIRPAVRADRTHVFALARQLARSIQPEPATFAALYDEAVDRDDSLLLVDEAPDGLSAYVLATIAPMFVYNGPFVFVQELVVDEARRGRRIGTALMEAVREEATARGARVIGLATTRAGGFYADRGFADAGAYFTLMLPPA